MDSPKSDPPPSPEGAARRATPPPPFDVGPHGRPAAARSPWAAPTPEDDPSASTPETPDVPTSPDVPPLAHRPEEPLIDAHDDRPGTEGGGTYDAAGYDAGYENADDGDEGYDDAPGGASPYGAGPVLAGGRTRARRRTRTVLAGVLVLLVVLTSSAGALLLYGRGSIERADIAGIAPVDRVPLVLPDGEEVEIMNVLLIGSDDRDTLSADERVGLNLEDRSIGRRPDTLMLAQLELNGKGAALLSFPRDLRVELCDGSVDKINASFAAGTRIGINGESCLVQTVSNHTGIEIHHYAEVDFAGFMRVIEVLGGVTMYLDQPMIDSKAHLNVPAGCVTLTPEQALGFVRSRGYDDDFGRIARQQRFIREVVEELSSVGVIANPAKLFSLVDAGANAVTTDQGFGLSVMRDVATGARHLTAEALQAHTVPADNARINGIAYVVQRDAEAEVLYAAFRDATVLRPGSAPDAGPTEEPTEEPIDVPPLAVLNATDRAGLAALAGDYLTAEGYEVAAVGNADDQGLAVSEVVHGTGHEAAAALVAESLPGAVVRADERVDGIAVVVGADTDAATLRALLETAQTAEGDGIDPTDPPADDPTGEPGEPTETAVDPTTPPADGTEPPADGTEPPADGTEPPADGVEPPADAAPTPTPERSFRGAAPADVDC